MIPFIKGQKHAIFIDFPGNVNISGSFPKNIRFHDFSLLIAIKFYNYNKSLDDAARGIKKISITLDNIYLTPKSGIILKLIFN